jgi:hypothetical protein
MWMTGQMLWVTGPILCTTRGTGLWTKSHSDQDHRSDLAFLLSPAVGKKNFPHRSKILAIGAPQSAQPVEP